MAARRGSLRLESMAKDLLVDAQGFLGSPSSRRALATEQRASRSEMESAVNDVERVVSVTVTSSAVPQPLAIYRHRHRRCHRARVTNIAEINLEIRMFVENNPCSHP